MINLLGTKDYNLIRSIITDPRLYSVVRGVTEGREEFQVDQSFKYLLGTMDGKPVGFVQMKEMSKTVMDVHIFTIPAYWGSDAALQISKSGHEYIKELGYIKTFTKVPAVCKNVLNFLNEIGYKCCGMIDKGIVWNGVLCPLFFYEFEVI